MKLSEARGMWILNRVEDDDGGSLRIAVVGRCGRRRWGVEGDSFGLLGMTALA